MRRSLKTDDFDYQLPPELIAQTPAGKREQSRLLLLQQSESSTELQDLQFSDFVQLCEPGDLLVVNNTRVVPARLKCHKPSGGQVEVMLERMLNEREFLALARSNKPLRPGQKLLINNQEELVFIEREGAFFKFCMLKPQAGNAYDLFHRQGEMPLPPYIKRPVEKSDAGRYQTVYARSEGAVAAPTAGLHFNQQILQQLEDKGVGLARVTLHVGAGTFQPVKVEDVTQHKMHTEWIEVDAKTVEQIQRTHASGRRVIAVGTTTVRALESAALSGKLVPFQGPTKIFIYPGYDFKVVDALLTNFHLPKSTLLMMISAFAGVQVVRDAYAHAIAQRYRFFSYGDAMFLSRSKP